VKSYASGLRHDYKDILLPENSRQTSRWVLFAVGAALPLVAVSFLLTFRSDQAGIPEAEPNTATARASDASKEPPLASTDYFPAADPIIDAIAVPPRPDREELRLVIERGDTLETLFRAHDLRLADLAQIIRLPEATEPLRMLRPGDEVVIMHRGGQVFSLERELDEINLLSIRREQDHFSATTTAREVDVRLVGAHNLIRTSLFESGAEAGISDAVIMEMAGIFQWDIDFIQDVRLNDQFTVLYEEWWRDGVKLRNGSIVAAEFVNRGQSFRAARFVDGGGRADYYTPEGRSVRKAFIRAPVDFTRVSDNFNPNRKHPILNTIRAHRGVDYAAPTGTPVKAAGEGKIITRGTNGSFGRVVVIQHGGNISTLYAHLSRYAERKVGTRVKQGDVIGYVGMSGLASGPHLHYEYRVNGVHRNPRTVQLPPADPVPAEYHQEFIAQTESLWKRLDLFKTSSVARNDD
jgi:murein DD-endopeptidase MepM/ murein hydrolase activator NlpD